jgi:hypothetical protein
VPRSSDERDNLEADDANVDHLNVTLRALSKAQPSGFMKVKPRCRYVRRVLRHLNLTVMKSKQ